MPRLAELYIATRTRNLSDAGTSDAPALLVSRGPQDLLQVPLDSDDNGLRRGKAALFRVDVDHRAVDSEDLELRLIASGNDAWAPEQIIAWGVTSQTDDLRVVPLGGLIDLATPVTERSAGVWLSTDSDEGVSTLALMPLSQGAPRTRARRLIVVVATSQYIGFPIAGPGPGGPLDATGTGSGVTLQAGRPGGMLMHYKFPETPQDDVARGRANFYMTSIPGPFGRADLADGSFVLSIAGRDWWAPVYVGVFGLDASQGQPTVLIPFVHAPTRSLLQMSSDPSEAWESNRLPTAQVVAPDFTAPVELGDLAGVLAARSPRAEGDRRPAPNVPVLRIEDVKKR
jgi:hypothetical protein